MAELVQKSSCLLNVQLHLLQIVTRILDTLVETSLTDQVFQSDATFMGGGGSGFLTLSLLRVINVKIPLQPHKKYDITQYGELDFS